MFKKGVCVSPMKVFAKMEEAYNSKAGLPPGTIVFTGKKLIDKVTITITDYSEDVCNKLEAASVNQCVIPEDKTVTRWIHIKGVHDVKMIANIGKNFGIHPLIIEDISSINQRSKVEIVEKGVYVVLRSFTHLEDKDHVSSEQLSFILGDRYVLSFQESADDLFAPIYKRMEQSSSRIRRNLSDYLVYSLLDLVVDNYFVVLEILDDKIEELEDELIKKPTSAMLNQIYKLKRNLLAIRKYVWPFREVVFRLNRDEATLIEESTQLYMRDLYDHVIRVTDHIETYRESLTSMLDIYLSSLNNRMNEVMKVLTVISTVFIPLTLIASLYGMNFAYMPPEAEWLYGYPIIIILMAVIAIIPLIYFKRIKWI